MSLLFRIQDAVALCATGYDIVPPRALSVHADLDLCIRQSLDEVDGRELAALIGVHDLGLAVNASPPPFRR